MDIGGSGHRLVEQPDGSAKSVPDSDANGRRLALLGMDHCMFHETVSAAKSFFLDDAG